MSSTPENITHAMADDYMKANAEFRSKAGIDTYIERKDDGKCCEWCSKLAGRYRYPEQVPRDVFRRHDNCGCLVSYVTPGGMRQNVHSKRGWNDEDQREYLKQLDEDKKRKREERKERWGDSYGLVKHERIQFTPKQAAEREKIVKEKIAEKRKMALTKDGKGDIIKEKGMYRKASNTGAFSHLPERMSKAHIRELAKKYNIDIKGLTLNIDNNPELLRFPLAGEAVPEKIGVITFFPNSFKNEEELVRTLVHEKVHVEQFRKHGSIFVQNNRKQFEIEAEKIEEDFINGLKKEGLI
jgi:hypothetical protein